MISLSPRHAPAAIALLLASAVPVWLHAAGAPTHDDCAYAPAILQARQIGGAVAVEPAPIFSPDDVFEGVLRDPERSLALSVRVYRTFEPFVLYWRPIDVGFNRLLHLQAADQYWVEAGDDRLPVHSSSRVDFRNAQVEAYVYVQGGRPVRHPVQSGMALGLDQLIHGTRPVWLLLASGTSDRDGTAMLRRETERWLAAAWQDLEAACAF